MSWGRGLLRVYEEDRACVLSTLRGRCLAQRLRDRSTGGSSPIRRSWLAMNRSRMSRDSWVQRYVRCTVDLSWRSPAYRV